MMVTIQVHIKQLNPHIPPSITRGSVPLAHKFNIFCHTQRGEGEVITPWLWRPYSTSPAQQLQQSQSFSHFDILLACRLQQFLSLPLTRISEAYEIREMRYGSCTLSCHDLNHTTRSGRARLLSICQSTSLNGFYSPALRPSDPMGIYKWLNCPKLLKGKPYLDYFILRKCLWIYLNTSEQVFSISAVPFFLG